MPLHIFSEYLQKTMDRRSDRNRSNVISKFYGLYDAQSIIIPRYNISWLVDGCIFSKWTDHRTVIWDKGVNQLVTMASFDHFAQILLIQSVLIAVFFGVAFYVFQKSDMAKRNNFMYFPWMEHLFVWIFPFCVSLFIVVTGFKIQSYTGGILAAVIATIIYYIVEKRKKRRAV